MNYVIIGASAAGLSAAKTLRQNDKEATIVVISKEDKVHSRCMLHHVMSNHRTEEGINFVSDDFFEKNNIYFMNNTNVVGINENDNRVILEDNKEIHYDKLLITSGAKYFIPPIPHFRTATNVYGLRDLEDVRKIEKELENAKKCVIVGSGLVGLDAANALASRGIECSIVEMSENLCPLQLDEIAAKPYQKLFEEAGCKFYFNEKAAGAEVDENNKITKVLLDSGKSLACDFLIVAAGVRPAISFLQDSTLNIENKIKVNEFLQTNVDNIWAAGDVTGIAGIWPNAMEQGTIAARNMVGIKQMYTNTYAFKNTMNFYGLTTLSVGIKTIEENDEVFIRESKDTYQKIVLRDSVPVYILFQGDIGHLGFWQELIKRSVNVKILDKSVFDLSYADFYDYDEKSTAYALSI